MTDIPAPCHCPACGCVHEPGCTPLAAEAALSRLTASPLPGDRVQAATKYLRENIHSVLDFQGASASYVLLSGVEDLARDVLALAAPASPLPGEIEWRVARLRSHADYLDTQKMSLVAIFIRESAAALQQQAREIKKKDRSHTLLAKELDGAWDRIKKLEAERDASVAWVVCLDCHGVADRHPCSRCNSVGCVPIKDARIRDLEAHCERLGQGGAERYWEGRWRDEAARVKELEAEIERLKERP